MSKELESLHPRLLFQIVKKLDHEDIFNNELYYDMNDIIPEVEPICSVFGISNIDHLSCEFLFEFEKLNRNTLRKLYNPNESKEEKINLIESLVIPKKTNFEFESSVGGSGWIVYYYRDTIDGYSEEYVRAQINYLHNEGLYEYWNGSLVSSEIGDYESQTFDVTDVFESGNLNESVKNINTIDSLSKSDLLKLKKIINDKLRRF